MMKKYSDLKICSILYLLCVVVSLLSLYLFVPRSTPENLDADESYYYNQSVQILKGEYVLDTYRPIGFPLVLAFALFLAQSNIMGAKIILIFLTSIRVPLVYLLVRKTISNFSVSFYSALIVIFWPLLLYYSLTIYADSTALTLFLAFLLILPKGNSSGTAYYALAGLFLALTLLMHPLYLVFVLFVPLIIFLEGFSIYANSIRTIVVLGSTLLIIAPWSLLISIKEKSFYLLSVNSVDAIAGTLNSTVIDEGFVYFSAPDGRLRIDGPGFWTFKHKHLSDDESQLPHKERNALLTERLIQWIKNHPYETLYLEIIKLTNMWGFYPWFAITPKRFFLGNIPIMSIFLLGMAAIWKFRRNFRELARFWTIPIFISIISLLALGAWRYRLSADVALIILSTLFVYSWRKNITPEKFSELHDE